MTISRLVECSITLGSGWWDYGVLVDGVMRGIVWASSASVLDFCLCGNGHHLPLCWARVPL